MHTSWASGELPQLDGAALGPRTAHDPARGNATLVAYRAWAERAGSQEAAFAGEPAWSPERRFARAFERLALPGLHRDARFDLLVTLGELGLARRCAPARSSSAAPTRRRSPPSASSASPTRCCWSAARASSRPRARSPLAALDLALWNWNRPPRPGPSGERERATLGAGGVEPDADAYARVAAALGL